MGENKTPLSEGTMDSCCSLHLEPLRSKYKVIKRRSYFSQTNLIFLIGNSAHVKIRYL